MALDFSTYLTREVESIEAPKPIPPGHYFATVKSWEAKESKEKKTPMIAVSFSITDADTDVDTDALPEGGVNNRVVSTNFTLNNEFGAHQLRQMIEALGIDTKGLTLGDALEHINGQPCKLEISQRMYNDQPQAEVKKVLAAD